MLKSLKGVCFEGIFCLYAVILIEFVLRGRRIMGVHRGRIAGMRVRFPPAPYCVFGLI